MGLEVVRYVVHSPPFCRQDGGVAFVLIIKINDNRGVEERESLVVEHRDMPRMENRGGSSGIGERNCCVPAFLRGNPEPRADGRNGGPYFFLRARGEHPPKPGKEKKRSEEHTSELQSPCNLVCRLLLEKKKKKEKQH